MTLTVYDDKTFLFDPTHDAYQTYLNTNDPAYQADADTGQPVGDVRRGVSRKEKKRRKGYGAVSFSQSPAFGSGALAVNGTPMPPAQETNGVLVDVSNNVGKTNDAFPTL